MITDILWAMLRALIAYVLVMFITRLLGRKAISSMTFYDFCIGITLGSVTANVGLGNDHTFQAAVTLLLTFGLLALLTDFLHLKSRAFSKLTIGVPLVLIENNAISYKNMKKARISISDLTTLLREKDAFNIADVQCAVIEINGELSVLLKSAKAPLTPSDMNQSPADKGLNRDIILDGNIQYDNLTAANGSESWLMNELQLKGIRNAADVFYAVLSSDGQLYVSLKNNNTPGSNPGIS